MQAKDHLNKRFGRLIINRIIGIDKYGNKRVNCLCDCGNEKNASINLIISEKIKSCGCLKKENAIKQLVGACEKNPLLKGKSEPRLATAKHIYNLRYKDGDLSFEVFLKLSQQNCYYCESPPSNTTNYYLTKNNKYSKERQIKGFFTYNGLDRINNSYPHDLNNVVPSCIRCNKAKLQQTKEEFFNWISIVYNLHCK